jgi:hypothetical protein
MPNRSRIGRLHRAFEKNLPTVSQFPLDFRFVVPHFGADEV